MYINMYFDNTVTQGTGLSLQSFKKLIRKYIHTLGNNVDPTRSIYPQSAEILYIFIGYIYDL